MRLKDVFWRIACKSVFLGVAHTHKFSHITYVLLTQNRMNEDIQQEADAAAWFQAKQHDTKEAYEAYLAAFPSGLFKESAQEALGQLLLLQEDDLWADILLQESKEAVENYLAQYPEGRYVDMAREKLASLAEHHAEETLWEKYLLTYDDTLLNDYVNTYPKGRHIQEAKQRKAQRLQEIDTHAWKKAIAQDSLAAYQAYLQAFPNGVYVQDAERACNIRQKIAQLRQQYERATDTTQKHAVLASAQTLMEQHPDDFAAYDYYQVLAKEYGEVARKTPMPSATPLTGIAEKKPDEKQVQSLRTQKPNTQKTTWLWIGGGLLIFALLLWWATTMQG